MNSVPREGVSRELLRWMLVRHDKMPGMESEYYNSLARLPNDLPTLRNYYSQMSMVDDGVGQVMAALEESGIAGAGRDTGCADQRIPLCGEAAQYSVWIYRRTLRSHSRSRREE